MTVLALCALTVSCARAAPPPYPLAFGLDGRSPRLLETSQEITVPLTIVNTGQRAWKPAAIHVSYHWLWIVPRELVRRSRTVPYQDGIRTELDREVAPGAQVAVRLIASSGLRFGRRHDQPFRLVRFVSLLHRLQEGRR